MGKCMNCSENNFFRQDRWNSYAGKWFEEVKNHPERFLIDKDNISPQLKDILSEVGDVKGKKILEYGSGRGELSIVLSKLGADVIGIDIGEDLVKLAGLIAEVNDAKCTFIVGNVENLPFDREQFDFVVGRKVLHHLSREGLSKSLVEAHRVLKVNGKAVFIEPVENSKVFDFLQNLFPVGSKALGNYRPSILNRKEWNKYLKVRDDRALSNMELLEAGRIYSMVEFKKYYGLLVRLGRLFPFERFISMLSKIDVLLTNNYSPLKFLSQAVMVVYIK
ncbi:MAG: class I SAM-dependent methyltransferase [Caldisericum sp.]|jgi:2-polyprenyl-3-methyl-5-hydroxy-6-metoxy-1,4-benzoquinol methylase|uniref:class I SAM-dependent methyltransferase n=2 Tax=Caldisericum sp. TaxID=2499687 RepID=UPI003D0C6DC0